MPRIEITGDTYRKLEELARPFKDRSEEDVIRRLADAELANRTKQRGGNGSKGTIKLAGRDLLGPKGRRVLHGTTLRATYKGVQYEAEVRDGKVWWADRPYSSLSRTAIAVIQSTGSDRTTEDGWRFWKRIPPDPKTGSSNPQST